MKMKNEMSRTYAMLNSLAEQGGVVIFGGAEDMNIPLCELKQAFSLNCNLYNRSMDGLSAVNAKEMYNLYVAPLQPECLLIHVGDTDADLFRKTPDAFDRLLRELVDYIRSQDKKCEIALISLRNPANSDVIAEMNRHIQYIAESERCQYGDITTKRVWNPKETQSVVSFVYSPGFVKPLKNKHPLGDIIRVLFCCNQISKA